MFVQKKYSGFSLTEISITVIIAGIIAVVTFSAYQSYVRTGRRTEAIETLLSMQLAEEKYLDGHKTYGNLRQTWGGNAITTSGNYSLSISDATENSYTLTAIALGGQANDSENGTTGSPLKIVFSNGVERRTPTVRWN